MSRAVRERLGARLELSSTREFNEQAQAWIFGSLNKRAKPSYLMLSSSELASQSICIHTVHIFASLSAKWQLESARVEEKDGEVSL